MFSYIRLHGSLVPLGQRMDASYERFASYLTELRMDHRDGQLASDRLTQLLVYYYHAGKSFSLAVSPCYRSMEVESIL